MTTTTGREYLRVSRDPSGKLRSPEDQHADHLDNAAERGVTLLEAYAEEKAVSASKFGTKNRDDWDRLLEDLRTGNFGADELWLWESSRGSRQMQEWVILLDLLTNASVKIWVSSHERLYNPNNYRDREDLLIDAARSESYSAKLSKDVRRGHKRKAERGEPTGRIPYGYRRTYDPVTRKFISQDPEPVEAAIVKKLFERLYKGHSLRSIEKDFLAAGYVDRHGKPFGLNQLRNLATRALYAGQRVHKGKLWPGKWEALVDLKVWRTVQRRFAQASEKGHRPGRATHLVSYIARCDKCSGIMQGQSRQQRYTCMGKGCCSISMAGLDAHASKVLFAYLGRKANRQALLIATKTGPELDAIHAEIARVEAELTALYDSAKAGKITTRAMEAMEPGLLAADKDARDRLAKATTPTTLQGLIGSDGLANWPEAMPIAARREVCRILFSSEIIGELRVKPADYRGQPAYERVAWRR